MWSTRMKCELAANQAEPVPGPEPDQNNCTTMPVYHVKGLPDPSIYVWKKGSVKKDSNRKTPCIIFCFTSNLCQQLSVPPNEFCLSVKYHIRYIFEIASLLGTLEFFLIQNGEELKNAGMNSYFKSLVSTVTRPTSFSERTIFPPQKPTLCTFTVYPYLYSGHIYNQKQWYQTFLSFYTPILM